MRFDNFDNACFEFNRPYASKEAWRRLSTERTNLMETYMDDNKTKDLVKLWKEVSLMVRKTMLKTSHSLHATEFPSSPKNLSLAKVTTTNIYVKRMAG
jgi:hypothetical protein